MADPNVTTAIVALMAGAVPGLFSWLTARAVKGIDKSLDSLAAKVDTLASADTRLLVEVAELRARVVALEFLVQGGRQ